MGGMIDMMARQAGFVKASEMLTSNVEEITPKETPGKIFGVNLVESRLLPDGWVGLRSESGVMLRSPNGETTGVPFYNPSETVG